jgi:ornithine carbamoyltransferase
LTLREHFGDLDRITLAYLGDGNNVCHSLMLIAAKLGFDITVITPQEFAPNSKIVALANEIANDTDCAIALTSDASAAADHHAIYTDTWVSMGDETEAAQRQAKFAAYQVTESVMAMAAEDAIFMHCLPAHRGHEVVSAVIDSPQSVVFDQAENRMHAQNAILLHMLAADCAPQHCDDRSPEHTGEIVAG